MELTAEQKRDTEAVLAEIFDPLYKTESRIIHARNEAGMRDALVEMWSDSSVGLVLWNLADRFTPEEKAFLASGQFGRVILRDERLYAANKPPQPHPALYSSIAAKIEGVMTFLDEGEVFTERCCGSLGSSIIYETQRRPKEVGGFHVDRAALAHAVTRDTEISVTITLPLSGTSTISMAPSDQIKVHNEWRRTILEQGIIPHINEESLANFALDPFIGKRTLSDLMRASFSEAARRFTKMHHGAGEMGIEHGLFTLGIHSNGGRGHTLWIHRSGKTASYQPRTVYADNEGWISGPGG